MELHGGQLAPSDPAADSLGGHAERLGEFLAVSTRRLLDRNSGSARAGLAYSGSGGHNNKADP